VQSRNRERRFYHCFVCVYYLVVQLELLTARLTIRLSAEPGPPPRRPGGHGASGTGSATGSQSLCAHTRTKAIIKVLLPITTQKLHSDYLVAAERQPTSTTCGFVYDALDWYSLGHE